MMRALFVREEEDHLVIGAGLPVAWFKSSDALSYGPTSTAWGPVEVRFTRGRAGWTWQVRGQWLREPPRVQLACPAFATAWSRPSEGPMPLTAKF